MAKENAGKAAAAAKAEAEKAEAEKAEAEKVPALSVKAKREGFRRAGRAWSKEAVTVRLSELTKSEIEQLRSEPMLIVADVEIVADAEAAE